MITRRKLLAATAVALGSAVSSRWYWGNRWNYIVVHHSAGTFGNIPFLQHVHRQRQSGDPVDAIPYHYIIGNGNGLPLGEIASDWRQQHNIWGMHVSASNPDRNWRGIGICLIGNFEQYPVPPEQYQSLLALTKTLMSQYGIPPERVNGHGHIHGESTLCPGRHFPMQRFLNEIA